MRALWTSSELRLARFDCLQPHYNLVHRDEFERELADVCSTYNIGVIPYSPLAGGFLTGKYSRDQTPESVRSRGASRYFSESNWSLLEIMEQIAAERQGTISQIALAWLLTNPTITSPIIGPRTIDQLTDNLGALGMRLTDEEMAKLDETREQ